MKMTQVTSSNINAIGYNKDANELFVEFKSRKVFVYSDVSLDEHAALMASGSFGKHFFQFIKKVKIASEVIAVDDTERSIKLGTRIDEIEYILSMNEGRTQTELDNYRDELESLELELKSIIVA